jgi:hypothetical protein
VRGRAAEARKVQRGIPSKKIRASPTMVYRLLKIPYLRETPETTILRNPEGELALNVCRFTYVKHPRHELIAYCEKYFVELLAEKGPKTR